jgi:hypothetical protein
MANPTVFRVSLVIMCFADYIRRRQTPVPFMELRAFVFLGSIPNPMMELRIKRALKAAIDEDLMHKFLPHIFETDRADQSFSFLTRQTAKQIGLKQITNRFRIEIEGYEVEQVDLDEIMHEQIYWREDPIGREIDHHLFKFSRVQGGVRLHLNTNQVYRYCAFYDEYGNLDGEYDEFDISKHIAQRAMAQQQQRAMLGRAKVLEAEIEAKTTELRGMIAEIEQMNKRLRRAI